jgi:hypothetical protein
VDLPVPIRSRGFVVPMQDHVISPLCPPDEPAARSLCPTGGQVVVDDEHVAASL